MWATQFRRARCIPHLADIEPPCSTLQCAQRSLHFRTRDIELPYPDEYDLERVIDDFVRVLGETLNPKLQTKPYIKP